MDLSGPGIDVKLKERKKEPTPRTSAASFFLVTATKRNSKLKN
jgi:hypothetical protein